jgi:hypothetical protein
VKVVEKAVIDVVRVWDIVLKSVLAAAVTVIRVTKKSVSVERPIELIVVVVSVLKKLVDVVSVEKLVEIIDVLVEVLVEVVMDTNATTKKAVARSTFVASDGPEHVAPVHPVTMTGYWPGEAPAFTVKDPTRRPVTLSTEQEGAGVVGSIRPILVIAQDTSVLSNPQPVTPIGVSGGPAHWDSSMSGAYGAADGAKVMVVVAKVDVTMGGHGTTANGPKAFE